MSKENIKTTSRTAFAIKNIIFNFGYQLINTIANIVLPPLIIGRFGSATNGLISTIKQIINYIQLVGAGISESTVVSLYKPLSDKNKEKISSIYNAVGKTFNRAGGIFSIISVLVAFIYPLFISKELPYFFIVQIVLILSISGLSEFLVIGKYRTLLIADQKMYMVNLAQIVGAVVSTALTVFMIQASYNIVWVQLAASFAYVCRIFILHLYIRKNYKYLDKTSKPDYSAVSKRKAATIHQVAGLIIFGSQTLFIANFCGLTEASVYSVYNLIFTGLNTVLATVSSAMLAGMGNLIATDNPEKVRKVYGIYELAYYFLTFTIYITALIMIKPFIGLYTRGITDAEYIRSELIILFSCMGLLNCLRTPGATMINAKGHYDETKNRALIEMIICLIGQAALVWKFGIVGVLLGTICAYLYRTVDVIIYSNKKVLEQSVSCTLRRILCYALVLIVVGILIFQINITTNNYLQWIVYSAIVAIAIIIMLLIVTLLFDRKTLISGLYYAKDILRRQKD